MTTTDLRALLGDRYDDVIERAAATLYGRNYSTPWPEKGHADRFYWAQDAAATLAAVLPDLLAAAWDEGHWLGKADAALNAVRADGTHIRTPNPYRTEPQPSVTRCASCDCLKPCDRMLDTEETR